MNSRETLITNNLQVFSYTGYTHVFLLISQLVRCEFKTWAFRRDLNSNSNSMSGGLTVWWIIMSGG